MNLKNLFYINEYIQCHYHHWTRSPNLAYKNLCLQSLHTLVLKNVLDIPFLAQIICATVGLINDHNDHMLIVVMMMMILHLLSFYSYALQILSIESLTQVSISKVFSLQLFSARFYRQTKNTLW